MKILFWMTIAMFSLLEESSPCIDIETPIATNGARLRRQVHQRSSCQLGEPVPTTRIDTGKRLKALRKKMREYSIDAYFIGSRDSHLSEKTSPADMRLQWITGFSGSNGLAVITQEKAAMWSDGRYLLQAEAELDCNWEFNQGSESGDNDWINWLSRRHTERRNAPGQKRVVASDPQLYSAVTWLEWKDEFNKSSKSELELKPLTTNLIDELWKDRPERSKAPLHIHKIEFAGEACKNKLQRLRSEMTKSSADALIITALDEVAWLFNLRGADFPTAPLFFSYAVVTKNQTLIYVFPEKRTQEVRNHLDAECCSEGGCVQLKPYEEAFDGVKKLSKEEKWEKVVLAKPWAYSSGATYAVYKLLPEQLVHFQNSPVMLMKAKKNQVEIAGMKKACLKDSVALIELASEVEVGMANGEEWNEIKVSKRLQDLRQLQKHYKSKSFETISAYGPNAAIIHYRPTNTSNTRIGKDSLLLLDSGAQYLDGTTDVTRTFSYGNPSEFMKEAYTRVLMGAIDLARATFPDGTPDTRLDILARWNLMKVGLNYGHGTGHGIGAYGLVHESPVQVRIYKKEEHPMHEGYFFSDEPGYYEADSFGIRLETVLMTVKRDGLKYAGKPAASGGGKQLLGFEPVALVPFEPKLIDLKLLNQEHKAWLNNYNNKIREVVEPELRKQKKSKRIIEWMRKRTEPVMY